MYAIDFNTCTIDDVIARSITCHPTMLADTLRANARAHFNARDTMHDREAQQAAQRSGQQCRVVACIIEHAAVIEVEPIERMSFGERLAAFSAAARLQCLPHSVSSAICARDDAGR
jgi:hypothetical protein